MIAIIGAMQEEIDYLKKKMKNSWTEEVYHFEFHYGDIGNKKVVLVKSGVGKTNAGLLIGILLSQCEVDYIINLGVCGGVSDKVNLFDLAVVDKYFYGDVELPKHEYFYGQMSKCPRYFELNSKLKKTIKDNFPKENYKFVSCYTSDTFVDKDNYPKVKAIIDHHFSHYDISIFDMESTAFAHASYLLDIPFVAIRTISDLVPETNWKEYNLNLEQAIIKSSEFVYKLVLSL